MEGQPGLTPWRLKAYMRWVLAVLVVLSLAPPARAGQNQSSKQQQQLDVDRLPISLERIQRELREPREQETRDGLNLRYLVQIYGAAPPIDIFNKEDNLKNGPVPYGAPTHQDMLEVMTPKEYRAPAMDFSALLRWLADKTKK
jgi:hypothetical protein